MTSTGQQPVRQTSPSERSLTVQMHWLAVSMMCASTTPNLTWLRSSPLWVIRAMPVTVLRSPSMRSTMHHSLRCCLPTRRWLMAPLQVLRSLRPGILTTTVTRICSEQHPTGRLTGTPTMAVAGSLQPVPYLTQPVTTFLQRLSQTSTVMAIRISSLVTIHRTPAKTAYCCSTISCWKAVRCRSP